MIGCVGSSPHDSGSSISGYTEIFDIDESGGSWRNGFKLISSGTSETATCDWNSISEEGASYIVGFQPGGAAGVPVLRRRHE